jgi:hypothetical protein
MWGWPAGIFGGPQPVGRVLSSGNTDGKEQAEVWYLVEMPNIANTHIHGEEK